MGQAFLNAARDKEADEQLAKAEEIKQLRTQFSKLHEDAFAQPKNAALRQELAAVAGQLGREDLAKMWQDAAEAIDAGESSPFALQPMPVVLGPESPAAAPSSACCGRRLPARSDTIILERLTILARSKRGRHHETGPHSRFRLVSVMLGVLVQAEGRRCDIAG